MTQTAFIVKSRGKRPTEAFDQQKLFKSILGTCLSVKVPEGQAESTANAVSDAVSSWLDDKPEVTSEDIRRKAASILEKYHDEAAHLYKHHHMVI